MKDFSANRLLVKIRQKFVNLPPRPDLPKIFYCHVPKCAGSSIARALWEHIYIDYSVDRFGINLNGSRRAAGVFHLDMMQTREVVLAYNLSIDRHYFGSGHYYCRPSIVNEFSGEWNFVTILRDPVSRWISQYVYNTYKEIDWAKNTLPLEQYIESPVGKRTGESFVRYFSSMPFESDEDSAAYVDEAVINLSKFRVVGTIENVVHWCQSIEKAFGISLKLLRVNPSPNRTSAAEIRSDPGIMKRIEQLCESDTKIYRKVVDQIGAATEPETA